MNENEQNAENELSFERKEKELKQTLQSDLEKMISGWCQVEPDAQVSILEVMFVYRMLLGRMPSVEELYYFKNHEKILRRLLKDVTNGREFSSRLDLLPAGHQLMSEINGFKFWFDTSDREMGARMAAGVYERDTVSLLRRLIKPGMTCLDVGAQTGFYTCLLADIVGSSGKVYSFEPLKQSYQLLRKNIESNSFGSRVTSYPVACSDESGELVADVVSGMVVASGNGDSAFESLVLDDLNLLNVDFCKIDIEGHEPKAVRGMESILRDQKPMILTEVNSYWLEQAGSSGAEYLSTYSDYGYKLYNCDDSMLELGEYREDRMPGVMNILALHPEGSGLLQEGF